MSIQNRVQDLFSINAIRLCQFVEIFQYSFLNLVIVIFAVFILNSFILNKNYDHLLQNKENKNLLPNPIKISRQKLSWNRNHFFDIHSKILVYFFFNHLFHSFLRAL